MKTSTLGSVKFSDFDRPTRSIRLPKTDRTSEARLKIVSGTKVDLHIQRTKLIIYTLKICMMMKIYENCFWFWFS